MPSVTPLVATEYDDYLPTHEVTPCGPIPTALDANGVYPYVSYCETSTRPVPKRHRFVRMENRLLEVTICPDLGGRVTSIVHKGCGKEVLLVPEVVRPARILPRFCFVAGGIQVSFPIAHSPSGTEKILYRIDRSGPRIYVTCGERELRFGMQWSVEYSLGAEDAFLTERVLLHNPGESTYPWTSWSNAAVPSEVDTEFHFPNGEVLSHASRIDKIDWKSEGPKREADVKEMTGYFWRRPEAHAFGAYTPSLGTGLYHIAEPALAPGMKLWSYGVGADREWAIAAATRPYIEIQGGPVDDQSIKLELKPKETRWHVECWIPSDKPLDIYALKIPEINLRPISEVAVFGWARNDEVSVWNELCSAYEHSCAGDSRSRPPGPPEVALNRWAPSGMQNLDEAFEWAIQSSPEQGVELWRLHHGTWLAGRGDVEGAIRKLSDCSLGVGKMLLARIHGSRGDKSATAAALAAIRDRWLHLHPQVMVERDRLLRDLGAHTLAERETWLSQVSACRNERIIERQVQLLIDQGDAYAAKQLLLSTPFQKVHQTYTRTALWMEICERLNHSVDPIPQTLGEDRLARFGAYREFE